MSRVFRLCVFFLRFAWDSRFREKCVVTVFRRFPILISLLSLGLSGVVVAQIAGHVPWQVPAPAWWVVIGILAMLSGAAMGLPRWWYPFQLCAPTACAVVLLAGFSPWASFALLAGLVLMYGGGVATRVPLYLSNDAACSELTALLRAKSPTPVAIDLGAGFGGPMRFLGRQFPAGRFTSVEASPATWLVAWLLALFRPNVHVRWGDLWAADLAACDLVYVFLSPQPMARVWAHFQAHAKPGALLVSNTFSIPDVAPLQVITLPGRADAKLFVYSLTRDVRDPSKIS